ncbi:ribosomal RNA small subunit methyltransferase A [bacterium]|nr:ribosomal RNA small subunit methyltransferase A [bacterium]
MCPTVRPLKRFSQNFLKDASFGRRLVESLDIRPGDVVLEIGPGQGTLTRCILDSPAASVIGVEIDRRCAEVLRRDFLDEPRFRLIERDFLKTRLSGLAPEGTKLRIIGNIPYAITSMILFKLLDERPQVRDFAFTMQKEVALRVAGRPGTKDFGIPSVLIQMAADVRILFAIPRGAFRPIPGVDSAVLAGVFLDGPRFPVRDEAFFRALVKKGFGQRRKMLRNSLKPYWGGGPDPAGLERTLDRRPEDLSVEEWAGLADALYKMEHG